MIHINANLDLHSLPKIKTGELNNLLRNLSEETIYITFYARKEKFPDRAFRDNGDSFLKVIVPYEEVLKNDNNLTLLLTCLARNVDRLTWLDYQTLKSRIESLLESLEAKGD